VQIDIRGEHLGRRSKLDFGLIGDTKTTLRACYQAGAELKSTAPERFGGTLSEDTQRPGRTGNSQFQQRAYSSQYVARVIDKLATDDAVFTCDVGTPVIWAARYLTMNGKRRLLGSFNHGSMANALPDAIGAQAAYPGRQVISMSGDGGFSMLMGEFSP